jgi:hypothetical protein
MKKLILLVSLILLYKVVAAQDILSSERNLIYTWNEKLNDWVLVSERNDTVVFTLTKDHTMFWMYQKGSGGHFKYFYKEIGKDMMWLAKDTTFYKIVSSEVVKDIEGNTSYKFTTRSGLYNDLYSIYYSRVLNRLSFIFDNSRSSDAINFSYRLNKNVFYIKSGSIK